MTNEIIQFYSRRIPVLISFRVLHFLWIDTDMFIEGSMITTVDVKRFKEIITC
jgi:hypothetical protein